MRSNMKYVVFEGINGEQIIIFPKIIQHSVMAGDVKKSSFDGMRAISGGFIVNGHCVGENESLRMKSRGDRDTALIAELLDLDFAEDVGAIGVNSKINKLTTSKNKAKRNRNKSRN